MKNGKPRLRLDQSANYQIKVQGQLPKRWSAWFDNMTVSIEGDVTILTGHVTDQPALHGLLCKIRDLGLPLLSVQHIEEGPEEAMRN